MFAEQIKSVVDHIDGGIGGIIMALDGVSVEHYIANPQGFDVSTIGMEFSYILMQVRKAGDSLKIGGVNEMVVHSEGMTLLLRVLTDEYFMAVILKRSANYGKARFLMRMAEPKLRAEL